MKETSNLEKLGRGLEEGRVIPCPDFRTRRNTGERGKIYLFGWEARSTKELGKGRKRPERATLISTASGGESLSSSGRKIGFEKVTRARQ